MSLSVTIVTPTRIAFQSDADEIQVPGWLGEYGVLESHAQMLTLTRPGVVTLFQSGKTTRLLTGKGFAETGPSEITLLVNLCEEVEKIDKDKARKDLSEAEEELSRLHSTDPKYPFVQDRINLAQARIEA